MTELETRLISLLKVSEAESKEREQRLLARIEALQQRVQNLTGVVDRSAQQVQQLANQQNELIERYNKVAALLSEEFER